MNIKKREWDAPGLPLTWWRTFQDMPTWKGAMGKLL